jgi:hypothetical protein
MRAGLSCLAAREAADESLIREKHSPPARPCACGRLSARGQFAGQADEVFRISQRASVPVFPSVRTTLTLAPVKVQRRSGGPRIGVTVLTRSERTDNF